MKPGPPLWHTQPQLPSASPLCPQWTRNQLDSSAIFAAINAIWLERKSIRCVYLCLREEKKIFSWGKDAKKQHWDFFFSFKKLAVMSPWSFFLLLFFFFKLNNSHKATLFKKESPKCKKLKGRGEKNEGGNWKSSPSLVKTEKQMDWWIKKKFVCFDNSVSWCLLLLVTAKSQKRVH